MPKKMQSRTESLRLIARFLAGASVAALGLGAAPAVAQDTTQQTDNNPQVPQDQKQTAPAAATATAQSPSAGNANGQAIVVTGIRASLQSARNIKKNANQMVDAVSAQDIGALPDRSVSEALQRIPGVTLQRTDQARDPARLSAEGGAIFIRGLSWTKSEFNGRDVFSANNGRTLGFEDVPADMLSAIEVYKNPTSDQIEGGIGGIVNLVTRKPFDQSGQLIAADIDYNYADLRKKGFWSAYGLYSNRWSTSAGEFGVLVSGSLNNIGNRTDEVQTGGYSAQNGLAGTQYAGQTYYFPGSLGLRRIDWTQRRMAFDASVQWKPASNLTFTLEGIYAQANHHDMENVVGPGSSMPAPGTPGVTYTFDSNNNVIAGDIPAGHGYGILSLIDARHETGGDVTRDYSVNAKWDVTPSFTVTGDVQFVGSKHDLISMTAFDEFDQPVNVDFNFAAKTPWITYTLPGNALTQQGNYFWSAAMDHFERNDAHQWAERADAEYRFADDSFLKSFRFGLRGTDQRAISRSTTWNWSLLSYQDWMGLPPNSSAVMLNQDGVNPPNPALPSQSYFDPFSNFFRGDIPAVGGFWVPTPELVANPTHAYEYLKSTLSQGWGWSPLTPRTFPPNDINNQKNNTLAGYGLLSFGNEGGPFHFDGNIGVRVVRTHNDAGAVYLQGSFTNLPTPTACLASAAAQGLPASICDPITQLATFLGNGTSVPTSLGGQIPTKSSYTEVLPTLNLRFFLQDNMFLRFAAGKAVTPPTFTQLQATTSLSANFQTSAPNIGFPSQCNLTPPTYTCVNPFTGNAASPTLKPIKSTQFDASWEYYFGRAGQLSAAVFYKDIKDYIFAGNRTVSFTNNGQTLNFEMTQLQNGSHGTIKGFELAYQQFYDFLPQPLDGFGIGANLTMVDSHGGRNGTDAPGDSNQVANSNNASLPLEGLSKWAYNVELMYSKYGIDARLAYNWREHYLLTTSAANINQPVWTGSYGQLDGSIFYDLTSHFKLGFQATNILASKSYLYVGYADRHPFYSVNTTDRRYAVVVRAKF
jgi:TonB-dependent receptor